MNYVNNSSLLKEIRIYNATGERTEALGSMLLLIATRYAEKGSFAGYSWKDDMIGDAVLTCIKYMHNFDPSIEGANPFAYFSKVVHNSFLNYISKQKKHSNIKDICYKNVEALTQDVCSYEPQFFTVSAIDYQAIRGKKKKKKRKRKKKPTEAKK
jgi:DNA-directed RNA polymerase specialized sigma24 family protein